MKISHPHKICYILPEYREDSHTHFSYIGRLLSEANESLDTFLIIEKGTRPAENFGCKKIKVIGSCNIIARSFWLLYWMLKARKAGYCDFYVHYSFLSAVLASFMTKFLRGRGRVFYWNCGEPWKYKRSFFRERFERFAYSQITFLVTGTERLGDEYARVYKIPREKIKIMPNWIDTERFREISNKEDILNKLAIPEGRKIIFFVHHLSFRKGSRMLLPVVSDLLKRRKDFFLIVAGSGPDEESLRSRVNKSKELSDFVRIIGPVANRDIQKYFSAADIFFMPSQEEGFPRVILESMAAGVPVVASNVGSVSEIVPPEMSPFIIDSNDRHGFVSALHLLLSKDSEQIKKMSVLLRSRAAEFETPTVAKIFINLFR